MTKREGAARTLWLSWFDKPWEWVRVELATEMAAIGMTQEDLAYELRTEGYRVSQTTVSKWLNGTTSKVPLEALQALVGVFARVRLGEWAKGAQLSLDGLGMDSVEDGEGHLAHAS